MGKAKKEIPVSKVLEAFTAIADQRVAKDDDQTFFVTSSDRSKEYTVKVDGVCYSSNDNATYWQHYAGYPIIAVLIFTGKIPMECPDLKVFKNIPWKALNTANHNRYDLSTKDAFAKLDPAKVDGIISSAKRTITDIGNLGIAVKGNREKIITTQD